MISALPADLVVGKIDWSTKGYSSIIPVKNLIGGQWKDARSADYPPNGTVFWPTSGLRDKGSLHVFTVRRADSVGKDEFLVDLERSWYSVIDVSNRRWDDAVRQLHAGSLPAPRMGPVTNLVYLRCKGDEMLGPLWVAVENNKILLDNRNKQLERVELRRSSSGTVDVEPGVRVYLPEGPADIYVDCRTDGEVLRSALNDAAKLTRDNGGIVPDLASTKRFINETVRLIPESAISAESASRLERALRVVEFQEALDKSAALVIDSVLELPRVESAIAGAAEHARQEAAAEARQLAEARMADEGSEITILTARRKELEESAAARRVELQTELSKLEAEIGTFESRLLERLEDATADAGELLADSVLMRIANGANRATVPAIIRVREPFPQAAAASTPTGPEVLESAARVAGLPLTVLVRLHEILHAGLLPVLTGTGAMTALHTYAQVALGARVAELPVNHDFLRPADLLGIRASDPSQHRLHGDLLAAARRECTPENPGLVVLEGFNCGSSDTYLLPWLAHPRRQIVGPAGARTAAAGAGVCWGEGLLLAATAAVGMTTAPVSVEFWNFAAVVDVPAPSRPGGEVPAATTISPPDRVSASGELARSLDDLAEAISPVFDTRIDLSRTLHAVAETQVVGRGDSALTRAQIAVEAVVVPALATAEVSPPGLVDDVIADIAPIVRLDTDVLENAVARARSMLR